MKIAERKEVRRPKAPTAAFAGSSPALALHELLKQAGEGPVPGPLKDALLDLLGEVGRLKRELDKAKARAAHLEKLADEDALMPVANRRAFMRELSRLVALAQRYGTASSIVYIDLNDMKTINDRWGHNAGDAALLHVARTLIDHVRHADVVARLGGDEFGVLLVRTGQEAAEEKAGALAEAIEAAPLQWNGAAIRLSAATGAYCFNGDEDIAAALEAADRAMYRTKLARKATDQAAAG
ncbi:GGDEF domain-containing protein [Aliidongia dinghuensis]|uniref:diguanylate cyclase n=1 Tax=Aliidongia dinghuensis TaxID=1867774 RepID=A0A8J2YYX8_9PROT|nr:GGDEF domain-containing protein [Aliidongia dinghuensis]GGF38275.1 GGDEF domain-containing protein [Aliidongia dinghuensis]